MRHRSTKTTEAYYARMRPEAAFRELRERCPTPAVVKRRLGVVPTIFTE